MPNMSCNTSTCPSTSEPAPIPIVGIEIASETCLANLAGIFSRTIAKHPAFSNILASSIQLESKPPLISKVSRPLMSSELPSSITESPLIDSNDLTKWSDEQLFSAGWTEKQIESYRSNQSHTSKSIDKMDDAEDEWDTVW